MEIGEKYVARYCNKITVEIIDVCANGSYKVKQVEEKKRSTRVSTIYLPKSSFEGCGRNFDKITK